MRHLIKKQIIELRLDRQLNHYRVQQQVSERYWTEILPMLEKAFDAISKEDELIEIDRFELNLGVVSVTEMEEESWKTEIQKKIKDTIAAITNPASSQYALKSRDRRLGTFDQWLYYMDHGFLAWNSMNPDENWRRDVLEAIAVDIGSHRELQQRLSHHPHFIERVVSQHTDHFLHQLVEILTAKKQPDLPDAIDQLLLLHRWLRLRNKIGAGQTDREFRNDRWQRILQFAAGNRLHPAEQQLATALTHSFIKEFSLPPKLPRAIADKIPVVLPAIRQYSNELKNTPRVEKKDFDKLIQDILDASMAKQTGQEKNPADQPEGLSRYNSRFIDGEGIFIVHAGTILLHPFMKSLFSRLGFLKGNEFTSRKHQVESVALIHWLATGRTTAEEYELALPKLVCAFSLDEPIHLPVNLPPEYVTEANDLLTAAIGQWSILKNTSVEGLREGFLQRGGKLFSKNGNLWLQVEKRSIDILLDYLPWNLGIIRLPWLKDLLRVEWR